MKGFIGIEIKAVSGEIQRKFDVTGRWRFWIEVGEVRGYVDVIGGI